VRGSAKGCWERRRSASTIAWGRASRMVLYHAFTSAAGRRRSLDELDGQTVGIFDHCRPCVTEDVRLLQYLHPCATQSLKRRVQRLDRERDVIQRLAARWNERPVLPASRVHALPRIPRHRAVSKSHAARRLTDGARGLERWPSRLAVLHLAGVPARARRFRARSVARWWKLHSEILDVPVGGTERPFMEEMHVREGIARPGAPSELEQHAVRRHDVAEAAVA